MTRTQRITDHKELETVITDHARHTTAGSRTLWRQPGKPVSFFENPAVETVRCLNCWNRDVKTKGFNLYL